MKIITNSIFGKKIFVQNEDLIFLGSNSFTMQNEDDNYNLDKYALVNKDEKGKYQTLLIPKGVSKKINSVDKDEKSNYDFVEFNKKNEIEFFEKLDYIIDFDEYDEKNMDEIAKIVKNSYKKFMKIDNCDSEIEQVYLNNEEYLITFIEHFYWYKKGLIKMDLPKQKVKSLQKVIKNH